MTSQTAARALELAGCDALVLNDPFTVTWLTGFAPDILSGPSPFAAPPVAVVRGADVTEVTLVVSTDEEDAARATGRAVETYPGFTLDPLEPHAAQAEVVRRLGVSGRVGVEAHALTLRLREALAGTPVDVAAELRRGRAVKRPDELERIRTAIRVCDAGQAAARRAARPGLSELALWAEVAAAMEAEAGERLPVLADLVSGPRTAEVGGPPGQRVLQHGELVLVDLVPRVNGYWGDSCATFALGEPPADARDLHARAVETLEAALAGLRPGVVADELDAACRRGLEYPHHTGHGLGAVFHEEPRIVPGNRLVLEAGMVVALEPGSYPGPWGLRVERVAVVTETGCEVLSGHDLSV